MASDDIARGEPLSVSNRLSRLFEKTASMIEIPEVLSLARPWARDKVGEGGVGGTDAYGVGSGVEAAMDDPDLEVARPMGRNGVVGPEGCVRRHGAE